MPTKWPIPTTLFPSTARSTTPQETFFWCIRTWQEIQSQRDDRAQIIAGTLKDHLSFSQLLKIDQIIILCDWYNDYDLKLQYRRVGIARYSVYYRNDWFRGEGLQGVYWSIYQLIDHGASFAHYADLS